MSFWFRFTIVQVLGSHHSKIVLLHQVAVGILVGQAGIREGEEIEVGSKVTNILQQNLLSKSSKSSSCKAALITATLTSLAAGNWS